jgi:hypothetical protein
MVVSSVTNIETFGSDEIIRFHREKFWEQLRYLQLKSQFYKRFFVNLHKPLEITEIALFQRENSIQH